MLAEYCWTLTLACRSVFDVSSFDGNTLYTRGPGVQICHWNFVYNTALDLRQLAIGDAPFLDKNIFDESRTE